MINETLNFFTQIFTHKIFIATASAVFISQLLKIIFIFKNEKNFKYSYIFRRAGMPSSHAATISALIFSLFLLEGITNITIAFLFIGIIIIRDIMDINIGIPSKNKIDLQLKTYIHKPVEVMAGMFIGILCAIIVIIYI
jgi:uncharacterized protein